MSLKLDDVDSTTDIDASCLSDASLTASSPGTYADYPDCEGGNDMECLWKLGPFSDYCSDDPDPQPDPECSCGEICEPATPDASLVEGCFEYRYIADTILTLVYLYGIIAPQCILHCSRRLSMRHFFILITNPRISKRRLVYMLVSALQDGFPPLSFQ